MPFPSTLQALVTAGYRYGRVDRCPDCGAEIGIFTTPGKREIAVDLTTGMPDSPVVRHYETCGASKPSPEPQRTQEQAPALSPIPLYGVTDKNMVAVGWRDGILAVRFNFGLYHYANVPEDTFVKLRNPKQPYPNSLFMKLVKSKPDLYPCTKVQ